MHQVHIAPRDVWEHKCACNFHGASSDVSMRSVLRESRRDFLLGATFVNPSETDFSSAKTKIAFWRLAEQRTAALSPWDIVIFHFCGSIINSLSFLRVNN